MEDDGGEKSSFVIGLIENRAKEVTPFGLWENARTHKKNKNEGVIEILRVWSTTFFRFSHRQLLKKI